MITKIYPKKGEIPVRIFFQILLLIGLLYMIFLLMHPTGKHKFHSQVIIDWAFGFIILSLNFRNLYQLYFTPFWVIIDNEMKTLEIKYLISKSKVVDPKDITGYSSTFIKGWSSKSMNYFGMFLYLIDGTKILLSDQSLVTYTPIEIFLNEIGVKNLGEEKYSFFYK